MCSTFGGWLAARSAGQFSTKYGKIEDMVRRLTFVDGRGDVHTVDAGATPDVAQWLVGSEGTLGIITEVSLRLYGVPEAVSAAVCQFEDLASAYRRLKAEQGGFTAVKIHDVVKALDAPLAQVHELIAREARAGR